MTVICLLAHVKAKRFLMPHKAIIVASKNGLFFSMSGFLYSFGAEEFIILTNALHLPHICIGVLIVTTFAFRVTHRKSMNINK
jgi:hypothetical protein